MMDKRGRKWDRRYVGLAKHIARWSKDPSTQVGAVIVRDNRVISTGFNGFPPGYDDDPKLYADRTYKYKHVVHAEINAVETTHPLLLRGAVLYCSFPTCPQCMTRLGQAGVIRVVSPRLPTKGRDPQWVVDWLGRCEEAQEIASRWSIGVDHV